MDPIVWEWLQFAVRWLHVITAIAWIGSSFYFIALDLGLKARPGLPHGVKGEEWQVHGGGFYHIQKYMLAPEAMPEHLVWFKWESYFTWLSGMALLALVYYAGAELYLIDRDILEISIPAAIGLSLASLVAGWIVYDGLCRSPLKHNDVALYAVLFIFLVALCWGFTQIFSGRAALLHLGAVIATVMTANVAMIIIPNQRKIVADLKAGRLPDPALGAIGKQRSTHNNYLTLPVIFLMLSNHYPLAFATPFNWVIAGLVLLIGAIIRHFFNSMHASGARPYWTWAVSGLLFGIIVWLSSFPPRIAEEQTGRLENNPLIQAAAFEDVRSSVLSRCSMCHAEAPAFDGIGIAPRGVRLDTDEQIIRHARLIYLQAARSRAMPPGNITEMTGAERRQIALWFEAAELGQ